MDKALIKRLHEARIKYDQATNALHDLQKTAEYLAAEAAVKAANEDMEKARSDFEIAAAAEGKGGKGKEYEIKKTTAYSIKDPDAALEWCKFNMAAALMVNEKLLIEAAKSGLVKTPGIVNVTTGTKVYIASDLSRFYIDTGEA